MKRFVALLMVVALTVSLILSGCAKPASAPAPSPAPAGNAPVVDEWAIPDCLFLTGDFAAFAKEFQFGAELAVENINAAGGIRGKPIRLEYHDMGSMDAPKALAEFGKVLDAKPLVIYGPGGPVATQSCMPLAIQEEVYCITQMVGEANTTPWLPWALSFIASDRFLSHSSIDEWLNEEPDIKKVVQFIAPDNAVWMSFAKYQREALEANGVEVVDIEIPADTVEFGAPAVRALSEEPDAMLFSCDPTGIAKSVIELRRRGWTDNKKNILFECAPTPQLWEIAQGELDGCYVWTFWNIESTDPEWQDLLAKFRAEFGVDPSHNAWGGYNSVKITADCFESLQITGDSAKLTEERLAIRDWMNNCTFDSVFGPVKVVDGISQSPAYLFVVENNQMAHPVLCPFPPTLEK